MSCQLGRCFCYSEFKSVAQCCEFLGCKSAAVYKSSSTIYWTHLPVPHGQGPVAWEFEIPSVMSQCWRNTENTDDTRGVASVAMVPELRSLGRALVDALACGPTPAAEALVKVPRDEHRWGWDLPLGQFERMPGLLTVFATFLEFQEPDVTFSRLQGQACILLDLFAPVLWS